MTTQKLPADIFLLYRLWPAECLDCIRDVVCELCKVSTDTFHKGVSYPKGRPIGGTVHNAVARQFYCYLVKRVFFTHESLRTIGGYIYTYSNTNTYHHSSVLKGIKAIEDRLDTGEVRQSLIDYLTNQITLKLETLWQSSPLAVMPEAERTQQVA